MQSSSFLSHFGYYSKTKYMILGGMTIQKNITWFLVTDPDSLLPVPSTCWTKYIITAVILTHQITCAKLHTTYSEVVLSQVVLSESQLKKGNMAPSFSATGAVCYPILANYPQLAADHPQFAPNCPQLVLIILSLLLTTHSWLIIPNYSYVLIPNHLLVLNVHKLKQPQHLCLFHRIIDTYQRL